MKHRSEITRRQLLKGIGAFAVSVSVPASLWGCAGSKKEPEAGGAKAPAVSDADVARADALEKEALLTKADPGAWGGKEDSHIPIISFVEGEGRVHVKTSHVMSEEHWIQYQYLRDQRGVVIGFKEHSRDVLADAAHASFSLPEGTTAITAYSYCNLHSHWRGDTSGVPA